MSEEIKTLCKEAIAQANLLQHKADVREPLFAVDCGIVAMTLRNLDYTISTLSAELAKAREVIDRLPKTADGVAVVPGMELWTNNTKAPQHWITAHGISLSPDGQPMVRWQKNLYLAKWFYSSEAAALAAKGPTNE